MAVPPPSSRSSGATTSETLIKGQITVFFDDHISKPAPALSRKARASASTLVTLRLVSMLFGFALLLTSLGLLCQQFIHSDPMPSSPAIGLVAIVSGASSSWDLADAVVHYVRCGLAIPPKAHIGCEIVILIACLLSSVVFIFQSKTSASRCDIAILSLGATVIATRVVFFLGACVNRAEELKNGRPKTVYVPVWGKAAYLLPRPAPRKADLLHMIGGACVDDNSATEPPPEDYMPDEAELERRRRGEAQPQVILPAMSGGRSAEVKTLVWPGEASSLVRFPQARQPSRD